MKRHVLAIAAFALAVTACTPVIGTTPPAALAAGLVRFDACEDFLAHVKEEAAAIVGPYGLENGGYWGFPFLEDDVVAMGAADGEAFGGDTRQAGVDYSTTNVQEAGVDEPDIVKTDGSYIYALAQSRLFIVDPSDDGPVIVGSVYLENGYGEVLLAGDTVMVLSTSWGGGPHPAADIAGPGYYSSSPVSVLTEIDVSDRTNPKVARTLWLDGTYLSARMTGDVARIVVRGYPAGFEWEYPSGGGLFAEMQAEAANRKIIEESTLENWLPYYILEDEDGSSSTGLLIDCEDAYRPVEFSGLGMLTVVTVDLSDGLVPEGVGVLAEGDTVYASTDSLYVASQQWNDWQEIERGIVEAPSQSTELHKFDISSPSKTTYRASGEVSGYLLNQFALSEHEGFLRVATTDQAPWWGGNGDSESTVFVLEERDQELEVVGRVGGLGKGEQIFSVRFIGDVGYVVTFRQTDPLYTIDLSDPTNPTVEGELKILGYSAYLHPLGDGLLLGVGQDADDNGRTKGTQVSVFDVSDLTNPVRLHQYTMEEAHSSAEWDHRAFLYWAPTQTAVLPIQRWGWNERTGTEDYFVGAIGLEVDRARGLQELGLIDQSSRWKNDPWYAQIQRTLVIDGKLYSVSEAGIGSHDLGTLDDLGSVSFS